MKRDITYNDLINDLNIVATYELIDRFDFKPLALHGFKHVIKVAEICETLLVQLGASERYIEHTKIAAFLHDLGMKDGKYKHADRSVVEAKKILKNTAITRREKRCIFNAIKNHSNAFKQKDLMSAALVFADKLDCDKDRLGVMGYEVEGLKESQFIDHVDFVIENNMLTVNFNVSDGFDADAFVGFYHSKKIFGSVQTYAKFVGLDYQILLNEKLWVDGAGQVQGIA